MSTVLVADDSLFQRLVLSRIIRSQGHELLEACNGHECLRVLRDHRPDLALLDLNMPELSGLEVLEAMRDQGLMTAVVVVTADIQSTTRQRCLDLGARRLLSKPPREEDVLTVLRELLPGESKV